MLLNLSNHPSRKWTNEQRKAAVEMYGHIEDLAFPNVPPGATEEELDILVARYFAEIHERSPQAVHLMGEMTFTYRLVASLKAASIPCIASTTERIVTEKDGKKIVQFNFVQFREY